MTINEFDTLANTRTTYAIYNGTRTIRIEARPLNNGQDVWLVARCNGHVYSLKVAFEAKTTAIQSLCSQNYS